jgi:hypothetical protein
MAFFQEVDESPLYLASGGDAAWLAFVLGERAPKPWPQEIEFGRALTDAALSGLFVFAPHAPAFTDADDFVKAIRAVVQPLPAQRAIVWLRDPASIRSDTVATMGMATDGSQVSGGLTAPLIRHDTLGLTVPSGASLAQDPPGTGTDVALSRGGRGTIWFIGPNAPEPGQTQQIGSATLHFAGPHRGCFEFDTVLERQFLHDGFSWGFQVVLSGARDLAAWLPLARWDLPAPGDMIGFRALIDPADPLNASQQGRGVLPTRTALTFAGRGTTLCSSYVTTAGAGVALIPVAGPVETNVNAARLVFCLGITDAGGGQRFQAAPAGDFILAVDGAREGTVEALLCALDGTEHIGFRPRVDTGYPGDRLRFTPYQPAYVPEYPLPSASPVGAPVGATGGLDDRYLTSWVSTVSAPQARGGLSYVAQPRGAPLYGPPAAAGLLGPVDPAIALTDDGPSYPLMPYSGVAAGDEPTALSPAQLTGIERAILAPRRRAELAAGSAGPVASKLAATGADDDVPTTTATTPAGLLVTLSDGRWQRVLLGQNKGPCGGQLRLCFCNPGTELRQALQTNGLFLVAANSVNLGARTSGDGACDSHARFFNEINIDKWRLRADVGDNAPGDYSDVLIVKARKGKLIDLLATPQSWTQAEAFAWPSTKPGGAGNAQELPSLSKWLHDYIADAIVRADSQSPDAVYFQNFKALAEDENWTGILVLRGTIAALPPELAGLSAGVASPSSFRAHHFGVNISQVSLQDGAPQVTGPSSIFGLIYYVDPDLVGDPPIPPTPGVDYAFRVLEVKALFENTAVKLFQSRAQLTVGKLLQMPVGGMEGVAANPFNTLLLVGSLQTVGDRTAYSLSTDTDTIFRFNSNIVNKIELTGAQMATRSLGPPVVSTFDLTGFIDFAMIDDGTKDRKPFDVLSFGSPAGTTDGPRQGLSFWNLQLVMTAASGGQSATIVAGETGKVRFDVARSTPREGSLFNQFALTLQGMRSGDAEHSPSKAGYLPVIADVALSGVDGGAWVGLDFQLNMGSPGKLAGSAGLTSSLLVAWAPSSAGGSYAALVGLQLPGTVGGAELLSLENVLKLSIGQLRLAIDRGKTPPAFVLMMTEIALKFLGLMKIPPSGSSSFYLFGNPEPGAGPSGLGWYAQYDREPPKGSLT